MPPRKEPRGSQPPPAQPTASAPSKNNDDDMFGRHETRKKDVLLMLKNVAIPLIRYPQQYVGSDVMGKYGITCSPLDFNTGKPSKGGEQYIQPIGPQQMGHWLQRAKPWNVRRDFVCDVDGKPFYGALDDAYFLWLLTTIYLRQSENETDVCCMDMHTRWAEFPWVKPWDRCTSSCDALILGGRNNNKYLNRVSTDPHNWQVTWILRCFNKTLGEAPFQGDDACDLEKPHVMCFLVDDVQLREDVLSTSELTTALVMASTYAILPEYRKHRVIPVTVISAAGRRARIVQGDVNFRRGSIEIRKTPNVSFDHGVMNDQGSFNDFLALLGWVVGEPVGKTTWA